MHLADTNIARKLQQAKQFLNYEPKQYFDCFDPGGGGGHSTFFR